MSDLVKNAIQTIKNWWVFLLISIVLFTGGIWTLITPLNNYISLAWMFGVLVMTNGFVFLYFSLSNRLHLKGWGWYLSSGLLEIIIGLYLMADIKLSMAILPFVMGFWLLFRGIAIVATGLEIKDDGVRGWFFVLLIGILLTIVSTNMIMNPIFGTINVVFLTGTALLLLAMAYLILAFKLRRIKERAIDLLIEYKESLKSNTDELKQSVIAKLEGLSPEAKSMILKEFKNYEKHLK